MLRAACFALPLEPCNRYHSSHQRYIWEVLAGLEDIGFELLASSLRADATDLKAFTEALAVKLEGALPGQTSVERKSDGFFSKTKHVHRIVVDMGDTRYELNRQGGRVQTLRGKSVRGIVLKTEQLPLDQWIEDLSRDLTEAAQSSEQARLALERLLGA